MWSVIHKAVAVKSWRAKLFPGIDVACICCDRGLEENILHRFVECPPSQLAWRFALTILYRSQDIPPEEGCWHDLTWQQCLLGSSLPRKLRAGTTIWSLLRGSVVWLCWLGRNAWVFNGDNWPQAKLEHLIWEAALDYARTAWLKTSCLCTKLPAKAPKFLRKFDNSWLRTPFFGSRQGYQVTWRVEKPASGVFV